VAWVSEGPQNHLYQIRSAPQRRKRHGESVWIAEKVNLCVLCVFCGESDLEKEMVVDFSGFFLQTREIMERGLRGDQLLP
jgi:hypothetical protein